jgi:pimeloyl-ACP methyl ester carboxylesterase
MIARITRALLLLQLMFAFLLGWGASRVLHIPPLTGWAFGLLIVLFVRLAINANNFLLAWRFRSPTPPEHRISLRSSCALFLGEFCASIWTSSVTMPFCRLKEHTMPDAKGLPVLLIHGYGCNSGYWHSMSKVLRRALITHYAIDLEPVLASIDDYVPTVHHAIEAICERHECRRIVLVGHSMGGLVIRAYFRKHGAGRTAKAITLGTPHHGTALAHYGIGINSAQMRRTAIKEEELASAWLQQLAAAESPVTRNRIISLYSHHDNIVAPQNSSYLKGAANIEYHGIGHVALGLHPLIQDRVVKEIQAASAEA